jgi:putative flippase GtrA
MLSTEALRAKARSPEGQKAIRYTLTSVVSVFVTQVLLALLYVVVSLSAKWANIWAVSLASIPSYVLNRNWAWGKRGRSHLFREVIPFWALALIGLAFSTWAADWAESTFNGRALFVNAASLAAFGILWVGKFIIFNEVLFKHRPEVLAELPALDGTTGLPT